MTEVKSVGNLPRPLKFIAEQFLASDPYTPEIFEMTETEMLALKKEQDIFFQLIFDKKYQKWYMVAIGDYERVQASEYIIHTPMKIKRSLLAFLPVDESWIRNKKYQFAEDKALGDNLMHEWDGDGWA